MANKVGIYYDESGLRNILMGSEIAKIEQDIMMQKLNQIQAEFLQQFGFEGRFEIKKVDTRSTRSRTTYRVVAADKNTGAALKQQPGWLGRFV